MKFERLNGRFVSKNEGVELTMEFLKSYGDDFILQEAVEQHSAISELCSTSLNTLRVFLYRSVKDNAAHVLACVLRVGKDGNYLDNAHAGGRFIGVDVATGELGTYVSDTYGLKSKLWNGIDYSIERRKIPCWDQIVSFAENIGGCHDQMRLVSLDVVLDKDSKPLLIEGNVTANSYWLFMLAGQSPFGDFTDEIIDYCAFHKNKRNFNALQLI